MLQLDLPTSAAAPLYLVVPVATDVATAPVVPVAATLVLLAPIVPIGTTGVL